MDEVKLSVLRVRAESDGGSAVGETRAREHARGHGWSALVSTPLQGEASVAPRSEPLEGRVL